MIRTAIAGTNKSLLQYFDIIRSTHNFLITGVLCPDSNPGNLPSSLSYPISIKSSEELLEISDAIIITGQALYFFDTIIKYLKRSRHVFILPDSGMPLHKIKKLTRIAEEAGVIVYFHHTTIGQNIKQKIADFIPKPEFVSINTHFNKTGNNEILIDILISNISLLFELIPHTPRRIQTSTVPLNSINPELLNIRIEFETGTIATLTISSFTGEESVKTEIFCDKKMVVFDMHKLNLTFIDKEACTHYIIKSEEFRSSHMRDEMFENFSKIINKEILRGIRFSTGIAAHQTAAGIIDQILPSPVTH
jgi:predicted dehydrogenase